MLFAKGPGHRCAANIAAAGLLSLGVAVAAAATATADPPDPGGPAAPTDPVAPPPQGMSDILAGPVTAILGQPAQSPSGVPLDFLLSQNPAPAIPSGQSLAPLDLNTALSGNSYLLPQMFQLAQPGEGNLYSIGQGQVTDQPALIPALKGAHALWHGGMGRLDLDQLGQPLPGTAPPPGTDLPPGPVQFYEPPPPPGAPPPPVPPDG